MTRIESAKLPDLLREHPSNPRPCRFDRQL
jgi:hypothetical protein